MQKHADPIFDSGNPGSEQIFNFVEGIKYAIKFFFNDCILVRICCHQSIFKEMLSKVYVGLRGFFRIFYENVS